ncbi:MAG: glycosyltransferase family 2 protein [Gemmatimonadaceae bacterium]|nr:glycosyltransferase family 2 protein [Trueperaceae bacterium]MBA3890787.1 glycosyltransferase family 2 protein [Gemmatimonadaceae bacterium]
MTPLVTIGIATYNRADGYLRAALASALAQTYRPLEIVVCDNASTDGTPDLVEEMADERVRYVRHDTNIGANANFAACLDEAQGEYFLLLHDDDAIDGDFVECAMRALEGSAGVQRPGIIRTGTRVVDATGTLRSERANTANSGSMSDLVLAWFDGRTSLYLCSTLYLTKALREAGGFRSKRDLYNDVAATLRVAAGHTTLDVREVKATFRRHGANYGGAQAIEAWCDDSRYLIDLMCELTPGDAEHLRPRALAYFSRNNYNRVSRLNTFTERTRAYWLVYRSFRFRYSPLGWLARRRFRRFVETMRAARGTAK